MSGYDFNAEMQNIKNTETSSNFIDTHGVEIVTIKSQEFKAPEGKKPWIEVVLETEDGRINITRFYVVNPGDDEKVADIKRQRIKRLLENCGANLELPGDGPLKDAVGKKVKALFKNKEYIYRNPDLNGKPEIKTSIEYSFCEKVDKEIKGNESYFYGHLSAQQRAKFEGELALWTRDNGHLAQSLSQEAPTEQAPPISNEPDFPAPSNDDMGF